MVRGLVLGSLAFAAVFAAERQLGSVSKDVARYNAMRQMSGDPPLFRQVLMMGYQFLVQYGAGKPGGTNDLLRSFTRDAIRYATLRTM